jgi:hypothetical protein
MQSKGAKIGFIVLLVAFGIGAYWLFNYGPDAFSHKETRKLYQSYLKAEATIVSQEGNGHVGKNAHTIWTLQFKDDKGVLHTTKMQQNTVLPKDNGTSINIYFNPADPTVLIVDEDNYNEVMH